MLGLHNVATIALAFVFGYALTVRGVLRAGVGFESALWVVLAADTVDRRDGDRGQRIMTSLATADD